jgi:6-pyruvoyltetrahydropterin/6-carboxytetrahydropterin synthase
MLETFKQFTFEAAHQTPPYSSLHGHSFTVCFYMKGTPDPVYGWSHNLNDIDEAVDAVKREIDHKYLNDVEGLSVPTLENVTHWLFRRLSSSIPGIDRVVVQRGSDGQKEGCMVSAAH